MQDIIYLVLALLPLSTTGSYHRPYFNPTKYATLNPTITIAPPNATHVNAPHAKPYLHIHAVHHPNATHAALHILGVFPPHAKFTGTAGGGGPAARRWRGGSGRGWGKGVWWPLPTGAVGWGPDGGVDVQPYTVTVTTTVTEAAAATRGREAEFTGVRKVAGGEGNANKNVVNGNQGAQKGGEKDAGKNGDKNAGANEGAGKNEVKNGNEDADKNDDANAQKTGTESASAPESMLMVFQGGANAGKGLGKEHALVVVFVGAAAGAGFL